MIRFGAEGIETSEGDIPGQTDGGFLGQSFPPRIFSVSKFFGYCNSHITVLLLIVKSAFGTACIHLFFTSSSPSLGKRYTGIFSQLLVAEHFLLS